MSDYLKISGINHDTINIFTKKAPGFCVRELPQHASESAAALNNIIVEPAALSRLLHEQIITHLSEKNQAKNQLRFHNGCTVIKCTKDLQPISIVIYINN